MAINAVLLIPRRTLTIYPMQPRAHLFARISMSRPRMDVLLAANATTFTCPARVAFSVIHAIRKLSLASVAAVQIAGLLWCKTVRDPILEDVLLTRLMSSKNSSMKKQELLLFKSLSSMRKTNIQML